MNLFVTLIIILKLLNPLEFIPSKIENCTNTIATIIEHEAGNIPGSYNFVYNQIVYDLRSIDCKDLTKYRWAIKSFPKPRKEILDTIYKYKIEYPKCQFIGNPNDLKIWASYGYKTDVTYKFVNKGLTVIGVNCE